MCIGAKIPEPKLPPSPPVPTRASEENRSGVESLLQGIKKRKGRNATFINGGLGDMGFGQNIASPKTTLGV